MNEHYIKISDKLHIQYKKSYSLGWTWGLIASNYGTCLFWSRNKEQVLAHIERHYS